MLETIKQTLSQMGYRVATRPYELNIVGIRTNYGLPNTFDDLMVVCYADDKGNWQFRCWPCTTDPGTYWLQNPLNAQGTAILKPGQYIGSHAIGLHRGKYTALVQVKPLTVIRDSNRNSIPDYNSGASQTGLFGINIHHALATGTTKYIDKFSAGCQVFANDDDFNVFMQLCAVHRKRYGNSFTYTLLPGLPGAAAAAQAADPKNALRPAA